MRESVSLSHIAGRSAHLAARWPNILVGPGDDCAVVATPAGQVLLTTDQLIEGRHFVGPIGGGAGAGAGTPTDLVARKAVARSVSDIAAMAGLPAWALAAAALPPDFPQALADELFDRMAAWAEHWGCPLVGGDIATTATGMPVMLTVTVGGKPHAVRGPVLRSGARAGDLLYVTGRVGGSLVSGRHLTFEPRLDEARWLAEVLGPGLHAMIDISDGVGRDAARMARASGVRLEIEADRLPVWPDAGPTPEADGEDYELLVAVSPNSPISDSVTAARGAARAQDLPTPSTCIGRVVAGAGCVFVDRGGRVRDAEHSGWNHGG